MVYKNALTKTEKTRLEGRGGVVLLDKEILGPGGAHPLWAAGSQAVGQPPDDERK